MRIMRKNPIYKKKVNELQPMGIYLILDNNDEEQMLFINHDKGYCFIITKPSNDNGLCCLHINNKDSVNVIGQIGDMDFCNLELRKYNDNFA